MRLKKLSGFFFKNVINDKTLIPYLIRTRGRKYHALKAFNKMTITADRTCSSDYIGATPSVDIQLNSPSAHGKFLLQLPGRSFINTARDVFHTPTSYARV